MYFEKFSCIIKAFPKVSKKEGRRLPQYLAGISACFGTLLFSGYQVWISPAMTYLKGKGSTIHMSEDQAAWMVSIYSIGETVGSLINPLFIDRIGRKYSIILSVLFGLLGLLLITSFESYFCLLVARILGGISRGIYNSALIIYLTEISENNTRGIFMNLIKLIERGGMLVFSLIVPHVTYNSLNLIILLTVTIFCMTHVFIPETPYFYFLKDKDDKAVKCLAKLRGRRPKDLEPDILKIKFVIVEDQKNSKTALLDLFSNKQHRRGLVILSFLKLTQYTTGAYALYGYSEQIFIDSDSPLNPKYGMMVFNFFQLCACIVGIFIIEHVNRRSLFLSTAYLQTLSLIAIGVFFLLKNQFEINVSSVTWIPLVSFIFFGFSFSLGIAPISNLLQGELFPMSVKGVAMAFGITLGTVCGFLSVLGYNVLKENFGNYSPFWAYAIISFVLSTIVFCISPETKGKTLEDIQGMQNADLQVKLDALSKTKVSSERIC